MAYDFVCSGIVGSTKNPLDVMPRHTFLMPQHITLPHPSCRGTRLHMPRYIALGHSRNFFRFSSCRSISCLMLRHTLLSILASHLHAVAYKSYVTAYSLLNFLLSSLSCDTKFSMPRHSLLSFVFTRFESVLPPFDPYAQCITCKTK